jgi:hypothetical protein
MKGRQYVPFVGRSILIKSEEDPGRQGTSTSILEQKLHCLSSSPFVVRQVPAQ